ncbi:MAG: phage portal protein [Pyrinomonadaceae bacterium]|nr:phage portal protein [Pyrinomonadaceae bacterium]MBP6213428.1 phage portal protein [Pyrinomonadaceae bacterium]
MKRHIEEAIDHFRRRSALYARAERYYAGDHDLAFATDKFKNAFGALFREFAMNLCPAICDAVRDKLRVTGFSAASANDASIQTTLAGIWNANRMRLRAGEVHKEALKCGDAYMIVWPDAAGRAVMYPNRAASCSVTYDEERPGKIVRAAKYWQTAEGEVRINLFYPDRIERYAAAGSNAASPDAGKFTATSKPTPNPFGVVPVFHFANNGDIGTLGRSELEAAMPIQDGLNKSILDMLVAMEFSAYRQRWASGIEVDYDADGNAVSPFTSGVEHVWISPNGDTRFGDFETANLDQFLKVKDGFRVDMASVTGTPLHYFTPSGERLSTGVGMRRGETRFLAKIRDRQESFGQIWSDVMAFALQIEGRESDTQLITQWEDPAPMSEREVLENILLKKQIGLPVERALLEAGYGEADVKQMTSR